MKTQKFRINPHYRGIWSSSYTQSDNTVGYEKYSIVHDTDKKMAAYMSLENANKEVLSGSSWMVFSDINSITDYVDEQITSHTQDLIKEQVNVSLNLTGGGSGWGDTPPTVTLKDQNGTVISSQTASNGVQMTFQVLPKTTYTIYASNIDGYSVPKQYTFTALSNYVRNVTIEYKYLSEGVYIELTDNTLVTTDSFQIGTMEANGVYVSDGYNSIVLALHGEVQPYQWSSSATSIPHITTTTDSVVAKKDYDVNVNGYTNQYWADDFMKSNTSITMPAFSHAESFIFPNGTKGKLPALGHLVLVMNNFTDVNTALVKAGGVALAAGSQYWSSTQYNATSAWVATSSGSVNGNFSKDSTYGVRAVSVF